MSLCSRPLSYMYSGENLFSISEKAKMNSTEPTARTLLLEGFVWVSDVHSNDCKCKPVFCTQGKWFESQETSVAFSFFKNNHQLSSFFFSELYFTNIFQQSFDEIFSSELIQNKIMQSLKRIIWICIWHFCLQHKVKQVHSAAYILYRDSQRQIYHHNAILLRKIITEM